MEIYKDRQKFSSVESYRRTLLAQEALKEELRRIDDRENKIGLCELLEDFRDLMKEHFAEDESRDETITKFYEKVKKDLEVIQKEGVGTTHSEIDGSLRRIESYISRSIKD